MFALLLHLLTTKLYLRVVLIAITCWQVYDIFFPQKNDDALLRQTVAQVTLQKAVGQMPQPTPVQQIAIADLVGDHAGYVKRILAEELHKSGKFTVITDAYVQRIVKEALAIAKKSGLVGHGLAEAVEGGGITSLEAAIELANRMGIDKVLFGEVRGFTLEQNRARLEMHLRIADARAHSATFGGDFTEEIGKYGLFSPFLRASIIHAAFGMRLFTWVVMTTLFPLVFSYVLIHYLHQESNLVNLLILVGLTLMNTLLAFMLMGFDATSFQKQFLLTLAFIGSLSYNYMACSQLAHMHR